MERKIIKIDETKCNGCGLCISACHEGALQLVNGKAKLISDSYCDGLGACLPDCPTGAITLEERQAAPFDEEAVKKHLANNKPQQQPLPCGCPGTHSRVLDKSYPTPSSDHRALTLESQLQQWPCQIKLVPVNAPYFEGADLLIAADCTAFAYANIHNDYMKNKITLIGCPKLDNINYAEKLAEILKSHQIKSITVLRMEVPCCSGIAAAVKDALAQSNSIIPWNVVTISTNGCILG